MSGSERDNPLSAGLLSSIANPQTLSGNFLAAYGQGQDAAQRVWANRLSQAQQAAGQAQQGAINPQTGEYDPNAFRANLAAAGPQAALAAQSSLGANQSISSDQLHQAQVKNDFINKGAASLLANKDYSPGGVMGVLQQGVAGGFLTPAEAGRQLLAMPQGDAGVKAWIEQHYSRTADAAQNWQQNYGQPYTQSIGGAIQSGTQSTQTGAQRPASSTPMTMTPEGAAQRVPTIDNNQFMPDGKTPNPNYGQSITVPLSSTVAPGGGGTAPPSPATPPRLPGKQAAAGPSVSLPTSLPPGADIPIKASNDAWATAQADDNTYSQRTFPLQQAASLLNAGTTTGPGTEGINQVKSWLQSRAANFGWNPNEISVASFDKLNKYLTDYVNKQGMATGSDARLASALSGNPSAHISTLANQDVVKSIIGLERMKHAATLDFAAQGAPNGQYNNFMRTWQTAHDPRAFIFDQMDDKQRAAMIGSMKTPAERAAFGRTLDLVERNPDLMNSTAMPGH